MKKIIKKPWGSEEIIEINNKFMFKKLYKKKTINAVFSIIMLKRSLFLYYQANLE